MNVNAKNWRMAQVVVLIMAGVLGISGCRTASDGGKNECLVRLINASPNTEELAVAVDGQHVWRHSTFRSNTGFAGFGAGTYQVSIEARRGNRILAGSSYLACEKAKAYTVLALGRSTGAPDLRIFSETLDSAVPAGKARVRFVNAIGGGGGMADVLFNNIAGLTDVAYGSRSAGVLLEPGTYDVKVNAAGEASTLAGPSPVRLQAGHAYTLAAMGRTDAVNPQQSVSIEAYSDDRPASGE